MNADTTGSGAPDTIVLIHGLWMTALSWEHWVERYEARGYNVHRPELARHGRRRRRAARRHRRRSTHLGVDEIVDHYAGHHPRARHAADHHGPLLRRRVHADPARPRASGAAGVAIDSAPLSRACSRLPRSTLQSGFPVLKNPANRHRAVAADPRGVPLRVHQHADRGGVRGRLRALRRARARAASCSRARSPTSTRTRRGRSTSTTTTARRCCSSPAARTTSRPASLNESNLKHYKQVRGGHRVQGVPRAARTTRSAQEGWEEVADYALDWAVGHVAHVAAT